MERTLRGKVAVVGVGETAYYKRGESPDAEFKLALKAIIAACKDAGISPREVDGFASYSNDRSDPSRLAAALGCDDLRFANMQWGGGGGGGSAALANASAAIASGLAECVVVFRALAQGQFGRFGQGPQRDVIAGDMAHTVPYGLMSPAHMFAMKVNRFMHDHGVEQSALRALSLASYHHAQNNPRAVMYGRPLDEEKYDNSRWIVEPFHLFDCCLENDGAAAMVVVSAERAKDFDNTPVYLLGATSGSHYRAGASVHNAPDYATSTFKTLVPRLYEMAGVGPQDVDVLQCYENFTGGVL
ncbi:MAG: acetyl-CoA acetyltransferase, partial [Gammaproteobacteria bacterium]|nr:acetyl-CoA acetyltransferase [Gammaproteobacteria bacterium]